MDGVSVASRCVLCDMHKPVERRAQQGAFGGFVGNRMCHAHSYIVTAYSWCGNYDSQCRHIAEPLGFYTFAWLPKMLRNGKRVWLNWVERHDDSTFTLGNRAH